MKDRKLWLESVVNFADLLKSLRIRAQLTQKDLSIAVGYSEAQISRLENGKRAPDLEVVRHLFVPALGLEDEPEMVARLLDLAMKVPETSFATRQIQKEKRHNLPMELTSLIGRETDLAEIARLMALPANRLLTLTGAGGCGKSRLALRVGHNLGRLFLHGAWRVELAPLSDPFMLPQAVIGVLGLTTGLDHSPVDILTSFLRERALLLILDNCEHLVEAVAQLTADLLSTCPDLKILATSREPLGSPGEIVYRVPSLAFPTDDNSLSIESYSAARLFLERAKSAQPGFTLAGCERAALAQICRRLDGIPLAIELAAARMNVLSVQQLSDRLQESFRVLGTGGRSLIPRHATLRAAVEWSYNLLDEPERMLLRRLALFAGSWTLDQAEEICAANALEKEEVLGWLAALINKSLVLTEQAPGSDPASRAMRYRLHEMVRQFALEMLDETGEEQALREHFLNCFIDLAETAERGLKSSRQVEWLTALDQNHANMVQALTLAVQNQNALAALRLSGALGYYWQLRDLSLEAVHWLETTLALDRREMTEAEHEMHAGEAWQRARAKVLLGIISYRNLSHFTASDIQEIIRECEQIYQSLDDQNGLMFLSFETINLDGLKTLPAHIERLRTRLPVVLASGDHWTAARLLYVLGSLERSCGNITIGDQARQEALVQAQMAGDISYQALITQWIAWAEWDKGNIRRGLDLLRKAACIADKVGRLFSKARALHFQSVFNIALGDYDQAHAAIDEAISIYQSKGAYWFLWEIQQDLSLIYILEGRPMEAKRAIENESVIQFVEKHPNTYGAGMYYGYLGIILLSEGQVDRAAEVLAKGFEIPDRMNEHADAHQILRTMGRARLAQGNLTAAHELLFQTLAEISHNRTLPDFPETLDALAQLTLAEGQTRQAARLLGASDGLLKRMEMVRYPLFRKEYENCRESAFSTLGKADFSTAYTAGKAIAEDQNPIEAILTLMDR